MFDLAMFCLIADEAVVVVFEKFEMLLELDAVVCLVVVFILVTKNENLSNPIKKFFC